jgi:two-component system, NtrC family, sensor kinase
MRVPFTSPDGRERAIPHAAERPRGVPLQLALLALVAAAFLAGIVPAGVMLERWVARELESRVRADLALAPRLLADRNAAVGDAVMMHAKDVAHAPGLGAAVAGGDRAGAVRAAEDVARTFHSGGVVVGPDGAPWAGPVPMPEMVEATRRGEMPVSVLADSAGLWLVSIAPVENGGAWTGAAGVAVPVDEAAAGALAGLTRADLVVVTGDGGARAASPAAHPAAERIAREAARADSGVHALEAGGGRFLYAAAPMKGATVVFARDLRREQTILGPLRRALALTGALALALALLLGAVLARGIARPVRVLAAAAGSVSRGDFGAPLAASPVREVAAVTGAFGEMRAALAVRIEELKAANRLLEERQARLTALQSELIQRERVAAGGRVAAELAHEIRNPVASLRNCLELLQRRLDGDPEGREYAALAIDELLRMHELAERMLHLNRPRDPAVGACDAAEVAREVAALARIGAAGAVQVSVSAGGPAPAAIPPDALKQVLINLVQNARDAVPRGLVMEIIVAREGGSVRITTCDNGPGIAPEIRRRVFDPFFTTRATAGGVGLGLFVVEGVVRGHGGTVSVDAAPGGGACFRITLPAADLAAKTERAPTEAGAAA